MSFTFSRPVFLFEQTSFRKERRRLMTAGALALLSIVVQLFTTSSAIAANAEAPNIVVIMTDDMGYGDISCFGNPPYKTPHLDQLAAEGMRMTDFHSNGPVCSPTRAALLTGRYQQRSGIGGVVFADPKQNRHHGLQMEEVTFAESLRQAGYKTGVFGKWHLGYEVQYNPTKNGFHEFDGYVSGNVCYQSHLDRMGIEDWWHNAELTPELGYCTHLITQHALSFIEKHQRERFCLYIAHECVHSPFQGPSDPPVRIEGKVGDIASAKVKNIPRAYKEMMIEMDNGVGEIVAKLRSLGLDKNTLVLFFSDNGATKHGSNAPWKGNKGSLWEGGHRVPLIAWHPGQIQAGSVSNSPAMTIDVMPTLIDVANAKASPEKPLDGVSLKPVFYQNQPLPKRPLYWHYRDNWAVRDGDWKLLSLKQGKQPAKLQLFNLKQDKKEANDLASQNPDRVASMKSQYDNWKVDIDQSATVQPEK